MRICEHFSNFYVKMNNLLLLDLLLVLLVSSCWSQQCNAVYKETDRPSSCKEILDKYPATPSGDYNLKTSKVYCDMDTERCGSKGWTRVAHVDMSNKLQSCPGDLKLITSPIRTCGGLTTPGCASANFSTHGISYSKVCGRLRGYQVGDVGAFGPYVNDQTNLNLVIDGVLVSHGHAQSHIWAYATGNHKKPSGEGNIYCPCADYRFNGVVPSFIGNDYYCDSGVDSNPQGGVFYTTPLWTGKGCTPPNFCCSHSGMPWFCKTLPVPTTDYIEIRNCHNSPSFGEDTAVELIELYIQ